MTGKKEQLQGWDAYVIQVKDIELALEALKRSLSEYLLMFILT